MTSQSEYIFSECRRRSSWDLASVLPRRWAAVFVNTSVAVGRDWGGGWADCNGTCSNSNYPWTLAAVEDLLGPRVAFIITTHTHRQVWSAPPSWHQSQIHWIRTFVSSISPALTMFYNRTLNNFLDLLQIISKRKWKKHQWGRQCNKKSIWQRHSTMARLLTCKLNECKYTSNLSLYKG